jgi:hypothetical protein
MKPGADQEEIVHYRRYPQAAAIVATDHFASPSIVPALIGARPRRGAGRGTRT